MPFQRIGEHLFANRARALQVHALEPGAFERCRVDLDHERAQLAGVRMMMRVEAAERMLHEGMRQRAEMLARAEPGEAVGEMRDARTELRFEVAPDPRVHAVGADDQAGAGKRARIVDRVLVARRDTDRRGALAQHVEQAQPADAGVAHAVDADAAAAMDDDAVVPRFQMRRQRGERLGVVLGEELQRALGKHHAETERRAGRVLLEDLELDFGPGALDPIGEVQAGRTRANDRYPHRTCSASIALTVATRPSVAQIAPPQPPAASIMAR